MAENKIEYAGKTYLHADITAGNCHLVCSPIAEQLSVDTMEADLRSDDTSLTNFEYLAPLKYFHGSALIAKFFVTNIERVEVDKYRISDTSAVGAMDDEPDHMGGIYTGQTAAEIIADIIPNGYVYTIDERIGRVKLYGWLPIAPRRDNLRQVLFALGANLLKDVNGDPVITSLTKAVTGSILEGRVFPGGSVTQLKPVTRIDVTEHQYIPVDEEVILFEGTTSPNEPIKFDEPMHSLSASGATILSSGANFAVLAAGTATLRGKKYIHTQKIVAAVDSTVADPSRNVKNVTDMTLVSLVNSGSVAERCLAYYSTRESITQDIEVGPERPGDIVRMVHPFGGSVLGILEDMEVNFGQFLRAKTTMRVGFVPLTPPGNLYENMIVLSESRSWVVPEGCTKIRVVVIGGGLSGSSGRSGSSGGGAGNGYSGQAGTGGDGGNGGSGGKILEFIKNVVEGQALDAIVALAGGESIFDGRSSAEGAVSDAGFTELTTGIVYGAKGKDGQKGPDGRALAGSNLQETISITISGQSISGSVGTVDATYMTAGSSFVSRATMYAQYNPTYERVDITARAVKGASGRSGAAGGPGENYGCGGNGGNGGEGGYASAGYKITKSTFDYTGGGQQKSLPISVSHNSVTGSSGGGSGAGGPGAHGCVIIYY